MLTWIHVLEGKRMFMRALSVRRNGFMQYSGNSREICMNILRDCYDKEKGYMRVSTGHFSLFYSRDFGWIVHSLLQLGMKKEVRSTLRYALARFKEHGMVRTCISPSGKPFDFPGMAIDSFSYIVYALSLLKDKALVKQYRIFLESQIMYVYRTAVDFKTGLPRKDRYFSSMKDHAKRTSSCYDVCMLHLLKESAEVLGLVNPFRQYNYRFLLMKHYWTGEYFLDDLSGKKYIVGDAQVFPFWCNVISDKRILRKCIQAVRNEGLDMPIPLRYSMPHSSSHVRLNFGNFFASGYEKSTAWLHMGLLYVDVAGRVNKKLQKEYLAQYNKLIQKYKTFPEVLQGDGTPYRTLLYYCDEGMSWCANYLTLK
ncbi:MAG: hypothetical protein ACMXYE_00550 [Candidatus Woesearchaeota archaeon]